MNKKSADCLTEEEVESKTRLQHVHRVNRSKAYWMLSLFSVLELTNADDRTSKRNSEANVLLRKRLSTQAGV